MRIAQLFNLKTIYTAGLLLAVLAQFSFANLVQAALPAPTTLTMATSSRDAYAKYQTITYTSTITKAGTLTHIVMTLPTGATVSSPRSSSGTVAAYKTGQIIWRPVAPIKVVVGSKLSIPVTGIYYNQGGTTNMWLTASTSTGDVLGYARGDFTLSNNAIGCQPTGNDYIARENAKPGSPATAWKIAATAFNPSVFGGFANAESYQCGDIAYLKVDSQASAFATVKAYRMGYYGGTGAREVWSTSDYFLTGKQVPVKTINTTSPGVKNMSDASHWNYNLGIRIDGRFTPGAYLLKLSDRAGKETYVPLTVRDSSAVKHDYLLQQATTTWQAYNRYGGSSFYTAMPNNATRLSFNRPYSEADGRGSGQFLQLESGLIYQMEKDGKDVGYWTDTDLQTRGISELIARTKTLILPSHDEYYSAQMRSTVDAAINQNKINLVSFGANQIHREIIYTAGNRSYDVRGAYSMTTGADYKKTTFRDQGPAFNEQVILGAQYGCAGHGDLITNNSWMWTGLAPNTTLGGFINGEADYQNTTERAVGYGYLVPVPAGNTKLVAGAPMYNCRISTEAKIMDIVARTTPTGARVFGGSTFTYSCFINKSCPTSWKEGPRTNPSTEAVATFAPLSVSDADSVSMAKVVNNVLHWANTGTLPTN